MAQYKVLATSWIGDKLRQPGEIIEFSGEAGSSLELVKAKKKDKAADAEVEPAADADPVI